MIAIDAFITVFISRTDSASNLIVSISVRGVSCKAQMSGRHGKKTALSPVATTPLPPTPLPATSSMRDNENKCRL